MSNDSDYLIDDGIIGFFDWFDPEGAAESSFEASASAVLNQAKTNAPWADRTGAARAGLEVNVYSDGGDVFLELYHTQEHGLWLETIQNGRFATIMPTLEAMAPEVFEAAGGRVSDPGWS